jgi:hypothetical protein
MQIGENQQKSIPKSKLPVIKTNKTQHFIVFSDFKCFYRTIAILKIS